MPHEPAAEPAQAHQGLADARGCGLRRAADKGCLLYTTYPAHEKRGVNVGGVGQPQKKQETAKKVEEKKVEPKPKVEKAPKVPKPEVKAPPKVTPKEAPKVPSVSTAAKVAAGAAIVGGLLMPNESVAKDIDRASKEVGVDKSLMYAMAKQESGFNPSAAAKTSSAKGLYQFIKGTWEGMVKKYGSKYPVLQEKGPEDLYANALAGALFIKENSDYLAKSNIPIIATTIYAAHFLG